MIRNTGGDKIKLVLELTEKACFLSDSAFRNAFNRLRANNVLFALDDFGVGYSNYSYLQALPVDFIKVDKSFIKPLGQNKNANMILDSIIQVANNLNIDVVAEGVETKEQAKLLLAKGVKYLQGYFMGHPLPMDDFVKKWIR